MLHALNYFFFAFHTALIFFNLFAWIWKPLRLANLIVLVVTGLSWVVFAPWYGFGYCPCTDWHWRVLEALGETDLPRSYIKLLFDRMTGLDASPFWTDVVTLTSFLAALAISITLNVRDRLARPAHD
jgi:hypothetical protein